MSSLMLAERVISRPVTDRFYTHRLVALFGFGWLVFTASIMLLSPLLPLIREDFGLSGAEAGFLTSALYVPYLLMQVPAGLLIDRLGAKSVLVAMTLLCTGALAGIGWLAVSLASLLVFGLLFRAGGGVLYPAAFGLTVSVVARQARGISTAVLSGGMALGTGVGLAIAVPLAQLGGSWRFPYLVMAGVTLLLAGLFAKVLRSGQRISMSGGGGLASALHDRSLWLLFAGSLCANFGFTTIATWGPSYLNAERGMPLALAGLTTALFSFIGCAAGLFVGRCSDLLGRRALTVGLFAAAALSLATLATTTASLVVLVAIVAYGLTGKWASDGALTPWIGDLASVRCPAAAASVMGFSNMCRMIGGTLAPPIAGVLLDATGSLRAGLYVGAAVLGLGALLTLLAREAER